MNPGHAPTALVTALVLAVGAMKVGTRNEPLQEPRPQVASFVVFRATTSLIQFDVQVDDRQGRPVTSLGRGDFEVRQDGVPVALKDVTFVKRRPRPPVVATLPGHSPVVHADLEPIVFLIDDMAMTPEGFQRVRRGLRELVSHGLPNGVEAGVLRTGEPGWRTTSLTSDPAVLMTRIDALRYLARSLRAGLASGSGITGPSGRRLERTFVEGTLGSLTSLMAGLRRLPGRKVVVLLSEGVAVDTGEAGSVSPPVDYRMNRLGQLAAIAGVTVHSVDVAGVTGAPDSLRLRMSMKDGLTSIAERTGGRYLEGENDLTPALDCLAAMERGYYLVSYEPPEGTVVMTIPPPFRRLTVRVLREGTIVRTRAGFFGDVQ